MERRLRDSLYIGFFTAAAHWGAHSFFGDASVFEAAGVNGAGLAVFVVSAGLSYWVLGNS